MALRGNADRAVDSTVCPQRREKFQTACCTSRVNERVAPVAGFDLLKKEEEEQFKFNPIHDEFTIGLNNLTKEERINKRDLNL